MKRRGRGLGTLSTWCCAALLCALAACGSEHRSLSAPPVSEASPAESSAATAATASTTLTTDVTTTDVTTTDVATTDVTTTDATAPNATSMTTTPVEYRAITAVLESPEHGPQLCLGGMKTSLPPQCGGTDLTNWDWSAIDGEQTANGTTWIDRILLTGHFDGAAFTVTDARTPTDADMAAAFPGPLIPPVPCPEPAGGWLAQAANAPANAMLDMNSAVGAYVAGQADSGGWWVDQSINPAMDDPANADPTKMNDPQRLIVVATFTGDLARHEADLRQLWPGALCVAKASVSAADLAAIATEISAGIDNKGTLTLPNGVTLHVLTFGQSGNPVTGTVDYDVVIAEPGAQAYFDETYGAGRVVLHAALHPVTGS
jgi:hypothetical protein